MQSTLLLRSDREQRSKRWKWTPELQSVFEKLRSKSANSIHLVHPDETFPYTINTDASGVAIDNVLTETDKSGDTHTVFTAARVMTPVEQCS
jgi:hypothetical protein